MFAARVIGLVRVASHAMADRSRVRSGGPCPTRGVAMPPRPPPRPRIRAGVRRAGHGVAQMANILFNHLETITYTIMPQLALLYGPTMY